MNLTNVHSLILSLILSFLDFLTNRKMEDQEKAEAKINAATRLAAMALNQLKSAKSSIVAAKKKSRKSKSKTTAAAPKRKKRRTKKKK